MKRFFKILIFIFFIQMTFMPIIVKANILCNDGTISPSCGDCHRGCCSHHGGCSSGSSHGSSSSGTSGYNNNSNNSSSGNSSYVPQEPQKSSDVTLKEVTVDNKKIDISDNMVYSTKNEKVNIYIVANDSKATIEYEKNSQLTIGNNIKDIKVIAENGNVKNYKLNIIREKVLSDNNNIRIMVEGKEIKFDYLKTTTVYLSNNKNKLDLDYKLEDESAKVEIIGNDDLKVGQSKVIVKVTAENGEEQDYTIMVEKYGKTEKMINYVIYFTLGIMSFSFIVGIGFLIYYFKIKTKKD